MPKVYDPILCMMVDEPTKARDELSLAQKKQVVVELKGFLKKSYNFSDESEYARAYEDLRHMFTTGSRKSISGLFENTVKKTGAHDSASALDKAIKTIDANGEPLVNLKTGVTVGWIIDKGKRLVKNSYGNVYKVSVGDLAWLRSKQSKGIVPEDIKAVGERMIDLE